jgi:hypothetical protein
VGTFLVSDGIGLVDNIDKSAKLVKFAKCCKGDKTPLEPIGSSLLNRCTKFINSNNERFFQIRTLYDPISLPNNFWSRFSVLRSGRG